MAASPTTDFSTRTFLHKVFQGIVFWTAPVFWDNVARSALSTRSARPVPGAVRPRRWGSQPPPRITIIIIIIMIIMFMFIMITITITISY